MTPLFPSIIIANQKGGVLKTTLSCNLAGLAARDGTKTMLVDLDPQGSTALHLGYPLSDGSSMFEAIRNDATPGVIRDAGGRKNLDVLPSGPALADAIALARTQAAPMQWLAEGIEKMVRRSGEYELVVFDTPPGDSIVTMAAMAIASTVIIPAKSGDASRVGITHLSELFSQVAPINPSLTTAGIVLTDIGGTRIHFDETRRIRELVGDDPPVFATAIRHMEKAGNMSERDGLLAHELVGENLKRARRRLQALRTGKLIPEETLANAEGLATDYENLLAEIVNRIEAMYLPDGSLAEGAHL